MLCAFKKSKRGALPLPFVTSIVVNSGIVTSGPLLIGDLSSSAVGSPASGHRSGTWRPWPCELPSTVATARRTSRLATDPRVVQALLYELALQIDVWIDLMRHSVIALSDRSSVVGQRHHPEFLILNL